MDGFCDFTGRVSGNLGNLQSKHAASIERHSIGKHAQNMTDDQSIAMQVAPYAEGLRRLCYWYFNRPIRPDRRQHEACTKATCKKLSQSEALIQFAKDLCIIPRLLHLSDVHEALLSIHHDRQQKIKSIESFDNIFVIFIIHCADTISKKLAFCSILSKLSGSNQVANFRLAAFYQS